MMIGALFWVCILVFFGPLVAIALALIMILATMAGAHD